MVGSGRFSLSSREDCNLNLNRGFRGRVSVGGMGWERHKLQERYRLFIRAERATVMAIWPIWGPLAQAGRIHGIGGGSVVN